jgi:tetratricopeptide (TPR) repeat protein
MLLGDAYLMQNNQNAGETVNSYERAAKADPKFAKPHYKIGKIYQRARTLDIAIGSYEKAIAIDPEYAPAYKELGEIYYVQKAADKAVTAYEKYLSISETPGQAKFQYAFFLFMAKNYEKANAIFKEVTTNPNVSPVALRYYAYSLTEQDKTDEARKIFEQYFQRAKPEEIVAGDYGYYGKLLVKLKEDSLANESFAKSLVLDSAQAEILQMHGDTYLKRKKYPEAIAAYKQLISIRQAPLSQDLWSIGRAYYFNEQFPEADSAFTQLAAKQPNMTVGYLYAARAKANIDSTMKEGLAKPMYESLLEKALSNPEKNKKEIIEAYEYLGAYSLHVKNDVLGAKAYYEKILALDPNHNDAKNFMRELNKAPKG